MIQISRIPQDIVDKYYLKVKAHNGYIFAQITKGMYGIPQSGHIAHDALLKHLEPYGYRPSSKTTGLWMHASRPINFTLVLHNFGVTCLIKEYTLYLKESIEDKYEVTTDWEVKLTIGISLEWDYEKGMVQIPIPGYVRAALHSFQHKKHKRPQDSPYPWTQPIYGKNNQILSEKEPAEELDENNQKRLQKIVGKFLYYARSIDPTKLMSLNLLTEIHKNPTIDTSK